MEGLSGLPNLRSLNLARARMSWGALDCALLSLLNKCSLVRRQGLSSNPPRSPPRLIGAAAPALSPRRRATASAACRGSRAARCWSGWRALPPSRLPATLRVRSFPPTSPTTLPPFPPPQVLSHNQISQLDGLAVSAGPVRSLTHLDLRDNALSLLAELAPLAGAPPPDPARTPTDTHGHTPGPAAKALSAFTRSHTPALQPPTERSVEGARDASPRGLPLGLLGPPAPRPRRQHGARPVPATPRPCAAPLSPQSLPP